MKKIKNGWTRELIYLRGMGTNCWTITPNDDSGGREVAFLGAGDWGNYPNDKRENQEADRVILLSGNPLPEWVAKWLGFVNTKSRNEARERFQDMMEDADNFAFRD